MRQYEPAMLFAVFQLNWYFLPVTANSSVVVTFVAANGPADLLLLAGSSTCGSPVTVIGLPLLSSNSNCIGMVLPAFWVWIAPFVVLSVPRNPLKSYAGTTSYFTVTVVVLP